MHQLLQFACYRLTNIALQGVETHGENQMENVGYSSYNDGLSWSDWHSEQKT